MAAVAVVGVGMMMMCCSSSVAAVMMSGEEKKDDSGGGGGGGADDSGSGGGGGADDSDSDDDTTLTATEQAKADADTAKAAADAVATDPDATLNEKRLAANTSALAAQAAADAAATDPDTTPADVVAAETEAENAKAVAAQAEVDKISADIAKSFKKFSFCFSGYTKVSMASGETMCIKDISLGDELAGGTLVDATLQIKNRSNDPFYRFNSTELGDCVYVTGSHYIHHDDKYIFVEDHPEAVLTDKCDDILYCLVTSDHTIPVGEFKFWDWEDNLIRH
jgi:hypothetical protein